MAKMDGLGQINRNHTGRRRPVYFKLFIVILGVAALVISARCGWRWLINLDRFTVKPGTVYFTLPVWAKEKLREEINKDPLIEEEHSIFEKDLTKMIAVAFSEKPWVSKVYQVKKEFPNNIKIRFSLRKPAAVVKSGRAVYLLDDECVRLPERYYYWPYGAPDEFYILNNRLSKKIDYWEKCDDEGIKAGVELAKFLKENRVHRLFNIKVIDVSKVNPKHNNVESEIVLITENGTKIKWGRSSLFDRHGELSDREKLLNLMGVARVEGRNLRRMEYVDVRWDIPQGKLRTPF